MEDKKISFGKSFLVCFLFAVLGGAFFFIAFHSSGFDTSIRHFSSMNLWLLFGILFIVLSAIGAIIIAIIRKKSRLALPAQFSLLSVFFALLSAILLLVSLYFDFSSASMVELTTSSAVNSSFVAVLRIRGIVGIFASAYFFLPLFSSVIEKKKNIVAILSFFPILWALMTLLCSYFNCTTAINDPEKTLQLVLSSAFLLGTLSECRFWIPSKNNGFTTFLLLFSSSVAVGISLVFFASHVANLFSASLPFVLSFMNAATFFAVSMYLLSRVLHVIHYNKQPSPDSNEESSTIS